MPFREGVTKLIASTVTEQAEQMEYIQWKQTLVQPAD